MPLLADSGLQLNLHKSEFFCEKVSDTRITAFRGRSKLRRFANRFGYRLGINEHFG